MLQNTSNACDENYTFKSYYFATPPSDEVFDNQDEYLESPRKRQRNINDSPIEAFFMEGSKRPKKLKKASSLVGISSSAGGMSYITTNVDDGVQATHLLKIEIYDLKKLATLPKDQHWKYADLRMKYYARATTNKQYKKAKELVYNITKEIAESKDSKKFFFDDEKNN